MTNFNHQLTQQIAFAIVIVTILGIITLALLYAGIPFFGMVNDLLNAVGAILIAILVWQLFPLIREKNGLFSILFSLIAWAGTAAIAINSVLVAFGGMGWKDGGMYTAIGFALIGLWLIAMILTIQPQPFLTVTLVRLGLIAGIAMLFGFLAGPLLAERLDLALKPIGWLAYIGAGGGWLMFPIWCWLLSRSLTT